MKMACLSNRLPWPENQIAGAFAELERSILTERTMAGSARARDYRRQANRTATHRGQY
jgi:hypothetical protein